MLTYETFDVVPVDEDCPQVGEDNYRQKAQAAGNRYIQMLEKRFPNIPEGCTFRIIGQAHDFGTYYEIALYYDNDNQDHCYFFHHVENNLPYTWDDQEVIPFN